MDKGYVMKRLLSSLRIFFVRYSDLIETYDIPLWRMMSNIPDCD